MWYGVLLHRSRYGSFVKNMLASSLGRGPLTDEMRVFLSGFITHPFLDRKTHPFIDYFAGWVNPDQKETEIYYRCHVFFERVLDVEMLRVRSGRSIMDYKLGVLMDAGSWLPGEIVETIGSALKMTYKPLADGKDLARRIENAYHDARLFHSYFGSSSSSSREAAIQMDSVGPHRRRLALFHPDSLPEDVDFLNLERKEWMHPCDESDLRTGSFVDLYEDALNEAIAALEQLQRIEAGEGRPESLEKVVGNRGLNTVLDSEKPSRYSSPLPLPDILNSMYPEILQFGKESHMR